MGEANALDCWAAWLLRRRQGGPEISQQVLEQLGRVRDRVVAGAELHEGDVLLDVGCGDGLIGFGGARYVGGSGTIIFSDVSTDLLDRCREIASDTGLLARSRFIQADAEDLGPIGDASVNAVTTRSVLIYVANKRGAFDEFHRVLQRGGRLSIFEPINRFTQGLEPPTEFCGYDLGAVKELLDKVNKVYEQVESPRIGPMLDFDERDLMAMAQGAGFEEVHLDFEAYVTKTPPEEWESFYRSAGNPLAPTLEEAVEAALDGAERERFIEHLRPLVEDGRGTLRRAGAYLRAVRG
jgi:arsenite methyltransferase